MRYKTAVYIDFDSLIRPTKFGWPGAFETSHEPKPGALQWLVKLTQDDARRVCLYSTENKFSDEEKIAAIYYWLLSDKFPNPLDILLVIKFEKLPFTKIKTSQGFEACELTL